MYSPRIALAHLPDMGLYSFIRSELVSKQLGRLELNKRVQSVDPVTPLIQSCCKLRKLGPRQHTWLHPCNRCRLSNLIQCTLDEFQATGTRAGEWEKSGATSEPT